MTFLVPAQFFKNPYSSRDAKHRHQSKKRFVKNDKITFVSKDQDEYSSELGFGKTVAPTWQKCTAKHRIINDRIGNYAAYIVFISK